GNGTPVQINNTRIGEGALGANLNLGPAGSLTLRAYGEAERYNQTFSSVATDRNSESLTDVQGVPSKESGGFQAGLGAVEKAKRWLRGATAPKKIAPSTEVISIQ